MAASYPGSVKTFTTKSAAQTIEAAHVNDLQDEVTAIEGGILNGTAPLASSNATVNSLQVSSGSTLNTLQVSSGSTFAVRPVMPPPDCAQVFLPSTVTLGSSGLSTLAWTQQAILTNSSMHSTATNPERLMPQSTGLYRVEAQLLFTAAAGARGLDIIDSSNNEVARIRADGGALGNVAVYASGLKRVDALGTYFMVVAVSTGASTLSLFSGVGNSWAALTKL